MIKVLGVEHIGIALKNNKQLSAIFKDIFDLGYIGSEVIDNQGVKTDIFNAVNTKIELLESISEDSPINKYISKRGEGIHHIALIVKDIEGAIDCLVQKNIQMIDNKPKIGVEGYRIAFIHPKSTPGLLIELCQRA